MFLEGQKVTLKQKFSTNLEKQPVDIMPTGLFAPKQLSNGTCNFNY